MKKLLVSMLLPALVIAPLAASAQTSTTPGARDSKPSDTSRSSTTGKDAGPAWKNDQNPVEARDIIGMRIKNDLDKDIGTVENLLIDPKTGKVSQVVVGVGGVLGVGEKKVVPWNDLKVALTTDGKKPVAKMNEAKLEAAPRYERSASAERDRSSSSPSASPNTTQSGTTKK